MRRQPPLPPFAARSSTPSLGSLRSEELDALPVSLRGTARVSCWSVAAAESGAAAPLPSVPKSGASRVVVPCSPSPPKSGTARVLQRCSPSAWSPVPPTSPHGRRRAGPPSFAWGEARQKELCD
nr:unnamed protein product [Digitaria exilis]